MESLKANCEPPFVNDIKIIMINIAPTCQASQHVTTCESPKNNIVFQNKNKLHGTSDTHQHVIARCKTIFIDNMCEKPGGLPNFSSWLAKNEARPKSEHFMIQFQLVHKRLGKSCIML